MHRLNVAAPVNDRITITVKETADLLGLSLSSTWKAVNRGEISSRKIGNRVLVSRAAVRALIPDSPQRR